MSIASRISRWLEKNGTMGFMIFIAVLVSALFLFVVSTMRYESIRPTVSYEDDFPAMTEGCADCGGTGGCNHEYDPFEDPCINPYYAGYINTVLQEQARIDAAKKAAGQLTSKKQ